MTDARVARAAVKVLVQPSPEARVARVAEKVLTRPTPDAVFAKVSLRVLVIQNGATSGTPFWGVSPGTAGEFWSSVF